MNWGAFIVLTVVFGALMMIVQRAEHKRRRVTLVVMLIGAELRDRSVRSTELGVMTPISAE